MQIIKSPYPVAPVGNPVIFSFSATTADTRLFQVTIKEPQFNTTIFTGKVYPTPLNTTEAFFNASNILSSLVRHDFDNNNTLLITKPKNFQRYYLDINEYGINTSTGQLQLITSGFTSNDYIIYESRLNVPYWSKILTPTTYAMTNTLTNYKFLTNQPDYIKVNEYSTEQLYFLKKPEGNFSVSVNQTKVVGSGTTRASVTFSLNGVSLGSPNNYLFILTIPDPIHGTVIFSHTDTFDTSIASVMAGLAANVNLYGYSATSAGNNITLFAPLSYGDTANGINVNFTADPNYIITYTETLPFTGGVSNYSSSLTIPYTQSSSGAASAEVTFDFNAYSGLFPELGTNLFTLLTTDPNYGLLTLFGGSGPGFLTLQDALDYYVAAINGNSYNYSATTSAGFMTIIAPLALGSSINGTTASWSIAIGDLNDGGFGDFEGGVDPNEYEYRLQVSPKKLALSGLTFSPGDKYTISVNSVFDTRISEFRHYIYEDTECNTDYVNILFSNSVGGVDTIQMIAPKINFNNTKQTIIKNNLNVESDTPYLTDEVYNQQKSIYANTLNGVVTLSTKYLNDLESEWLTELINSQNVYVELNNGDLLPVVLVNNDYAMKKKKYQNNEFISYDFSFELPSNVFNIYDNTISIIQNI